MTVPRAALYIGGASLLVAWLSSAASLSVQQNPAPAATPVPDEPSVELLVAGVRAQAHKLKERLASAPAPEEPLRNPFAFRTVEVPRPARRIQAAAFEPTAPDPVEPRLSLIGIAEEQKGETLVRTAMLAGDPEELFIVSVGEVVRDRYKVTAIGAADLELADVTTGAARRLVLDR